ncbi:MAG TPA: hypothetical protein PLU99_14110, partial [Phycisphaerae bacterium]|nr:hypothetical protein [Phycisphaerae bacterium]
MADERTGIKYIGKDATYKDRMFGTGLVWRQGEILPISIDLAKDFLKHPALFAEEPGFSYLGVTRSAQGVGNIIPMVGGKYAPTQADLLRLFPLPTHRVIADPWTVNIAGATKPAGATITIEADANEYGGSVIRIDLPAGVVGGAITLPINPDITGAYPKALPETAWRMNVSDWSAVSRL